ncbi:MAG: OmpA family protein [Rhodospirillales bacterium]|nr:OmpA family protein [Rhodospirillales bacterium]
MSRPAEEKLVGTAPPPLEPSLELPLEPPREPPLEPGLPAPRRGASSQVWMVSFTDLIALMLTFFVMMFAMSKVEFRKWQNLTDALAENLNAVRETSAAQPGAQLGIEVLRPLAGADLDYLAALLGQNMAAEPLLAEGLLLRLEDRIVIALPGDLLFAPGSIELAPAGRTAMAALGNLLRHVENRVEVAGYADPRQPGGGFASNWDLSLVRALTVAELLGHSGYRGDVMVRGFGHSRFEDLAADLDTGRRLELGRRVEVVVHSESGYQPGDAPGASP